MTSSESTYEAPTSQLEMDLVAVWEKVMERRPIGVTDDFFDMGGQSLLALRILAEIEKIVGVPIPLAAFAQARTIQKMAHYLGEQGLWSHLVPIQPKGKKYPFFCVPPSVSTAMIFNDLAKHLGEDQPFYGLDFSGMNGESQPQNNVNVMAEQNLAEIRTLQPNGPYFLGGMCFGGMVAYEMAQQLVAQNQPVAFLGILDSSFAPRQSRDISSYIFTVMKIINDKIFQNRLSLGPRYLGQRIRKHHTDTTIEQQLLRVSEAHIYARMQYTSSPYPGIITLFSTERQIAPKARALWQKATLLPLEIVPIPGGHGQRHLKRYRSQFPFIDEPNVNYLAEQLSFHLDQAYSKLDQD
jgi:thioesterase domain-containing protein/acyl carrier protein